MLNDPTAIRDANEKLYAFRFSEFMPRSIVSSDPKRLLAFAGEVGGRAVIKPLDGAGGSGVLALSLRRSQRAINRRHLDEGGARACPRARVPAGRSCR